MAADTRTVEITLQGHLTAASLQGQLNRVQQQLGVLPEGERAALIVDALTMSDYDPEARELFVRFNSACKKRISRVAILTDKTLWLMVISAMALASGQKMRAFHARDDALSWLADPPT